MAPFTPFLLYKPGGNLWVTRSTVRPGGFICWMETELCSEKRCTRGKNREERKKKRLLLQGAVKLAGLEVVCIVMSCSSSHQSDPTPSVFLSLHFNWLVVKFFKHCETADIHCNIMWIIYRSCSRWAFFFSFFFFYENWIKGKRELEGGERRRGAVIVQQYVACWVLNVFASASDCIWDFRGVCTMRSY